MHLELVSKWDIKRDILLTSGNFKLWSEELPFHTCCTLFLATCTTMHTADFAPRLLLTRMLLLFLCVALSLIVAVSLRALRRKLRIARGLAPLQGPKGVFLLGNIPAFIRNKNRMYHFLVRTMRAPLAVVLRVPFTLTRAALRRRSGCVSLEAS